MKVGYYVPTILHAPNTTPYRHAQAIGKRTSADLLLTENSNPPPKEISELFSENYILDGDGFSGPLQKAAQARKIINRSLESSSVLVTGLGYGPTITGAFSNINWIADVYDDPYQYIINNSNPIQFLGTQAILLLLRKSDIALITQHPSSPLKSGKRQIYVRNGAPVDIIQPGDKPSRDPLQTIIVGTQEGFGKVAQAISKCEAQIELQVFGRTNSRSVELAKQAGVDDQVQFNGWVDYEIVRENLRTSHAGFCLWPKQRDLDYSYPLKVGEYMAAGTIPVLTPRPGMKELAGKAGEYCESISEVAKLLDHLSTISRREFETKAICVRERAEAVSWESELTRFVNTIENVGEQ